MRLDDWTPSVLLTFVLLWYDYFTWKVYLGSQFWWINISPGKACWSICIGRSGSVGWWLFHLATEGKQDSDQSLRYIEPWRVCLYLPTSPLKPSESIPSWVFCHWLSLRAILSKIAIRKRKRPCMDTCLQNAFISTTRLHASSMKTSNQSTRSHWKAWHLEVLNYRVLKFMKLNSTTFTWWSLGRIIFRYKIHIMCLT